MMALRWLDAESSMLKRMAYDPDTSLLYVQFANGDVYRYEDVIGEDVSEVLFAEESQGKAFNRLIKGGDYDFEKLNPEEAEELLGAQA